MKIPYIFLNFDQDSPNKGYWDQTLITDLLEGKLWQPAQGYELVEAENVDQMWGGIVIIPGRQNAPYLDKVQEFIDQSKWVILVITGDEERSFDYKALKHDRMKVWLMDPKLDDEADYYIGSGYSPGIKKIKNPDFNKMYDWSFMGQNNHPRREEAMVVLRKMLNRDDVEGLLRETEGFTQGFTPDAYGITMSCTKVAPCPSGIQSPDSFRVYEALELGAVPVADDISTVLVHEPGYWEKVFNGAGVPFKVYTDTKNLEGYIMDVVREFPAYNNRVFAWWQRVKYEMVYTLHQHINELSGLDYFTDSLRSKITILILTSPIHSHPSTEVIEKTIADMRACLPYCEIIIGVDGVRPEQEEYRERYEQYKQQLLWKCNNEWHNVLPVLFEEHMHQSGMTRKMLTMVHTPTVLFVEHDTAITPDYAAEIPFMNMVKSIEGGDANVIRFHHEALILPDHEHMMIGEPELHGWIEESHDLTTSVRLRKTYQWSQRPHLASTAFYRDIMDRWFTEESRTMIEDAVHGRLISAYQDEGITGWNLWRVWIYTPIGDNIKRSYTVDGRGEDPKFEMKF